jgi:hypothetical protein
MTEIIHQRYWLDADFVGERNQTLTRMRACCFSFCWRTILVLLGGRRQKVHSVEIGFGSRIGGFSVSSSLVVLCVRVCVVDKENVMLGVSCLLYAHWRAQQNVKLLPYLDLFSLHRVSKEQLASKKLFVVI